MVVSEKKDKKKNIGKRVYYSILLSLTGILLAAAAFGLIKLWGFLEEYELTQQSYVTEPILAELNVGNYTKLFEGLDAEISPYETKEALHEQITDRLNGEFTATKSAKYSTEDAPVYLLKSGGENIALLELKKTSKTPKYGLDVYGYNRIYGITATMNEEVKIVIPNTVKFTVNGKSPENEFFTEEQIPETERFGEFLVGKPKMRTYKLTGLMNPPEIRFYNANGEEIPVSPENGVYTCGLPTLDSSLAKEAEEFATEFAKLYSEFVAYDIYFADLKPYLKKGTEFYDNLKTFNAQFYTPHQGYEFREEKILGTTQYSDACFTVKPEYDHVIKFYAQEKVYHTSYTVYAVKTDEGWKAIDLTIN